MRRRGGKRLKDERFLAASTFTFSDDDESNMIHDQEGGDAENKEPEYSVCFFN